MATVTLTESAKLSQDSLVQGVIENVITVNRMFEVLPFDGIEGNAISYNRENVLGAVATVGIGDTEGVIGSSASAGTNLTARQAAKNAATFTNVASSLTTILGDAEVNGLIQATRSNITDQTATQIASKAKSAGRSFQSQLITGDGTNNTFSGLISLCVSGQTVGATGANGDALSFATMDEMLDLVVDKDGDVDYIAMHARTMRSFRALLRGLGGASIADVVELPSGSTVPAYNGVPIFRNDYVPTNQTTGTTTTTTSIFAGNMDDGSRSHGIAGLTAATDAGIQVEDAGVSETKDERIWRIKWYCGLALFSEKGLACATGITN